MGISFRLKREYREELPDFLKEDISISLEELANESGRCDLEEPIEENTDDELVRMRRERLERKMFRKGDGEAKIEGQPNGRPHNIAVSEKTLARRRTTV